MNKTKFIALIMIFVMSLAPVTAIAVELEVPNNPIVYTAIGDSIAFGIGGEVVEFSPLDCYGYSDMLNSHLETIHGKDKVVIFDRGVASGGSSSLMRNLLQEALTSYIAGTPNENYNEISSSHIITLSIGGNDVLAAAAGAGLTPASTEITAEQFTALQNALMQFSINLTADGSNISDMGILKILRIINPTADIYVNTVYNPFKGTALEIETNKIFEGFEHPIAGFVPGLNTIIRAAESYADYEVVEVYGTFSQYNNPNKLLVHMEFSEQPDKAIYHPTARGYRMIFNLIKDLMD